ncbi:MAG: hypothetical protein RLZZ435_2323 [Cyanobacteriota bacterium]|jgi:hypothetical protein
MLTKTLTLPPLPVYFTPHPLTDQCRTLPPYVGSHFKKACEGIDLRQTSVSSIIVREPRNIQNRFRALRSPLFIEVSLNCSLWLKSLVVSPREMMILNFVDSYPPVYGSRVLLAGAASLGILLSGCQAPSPEQSTAPTPSSIQETSVPSATPFAVNPSTAPSATTIVTIYEIDQTCENLIPVEITVPTDQLLEASIANILSRSSPADLSPLAYNLSIEATTGQATLDLRPNPSSSSQRSLQSLSSCEQLALLGSLRETLLSHPEWSIQSVRFTEKGEALLL